MDHTDWTADLRSAPLAGAQLRYLRTGAGPSIVFLHPLRTQLDSFLPLVRALGHGFDVALPDVPGHAHSSAPAVEYSAAYFTNASEQFLPACALQETLLVGESIGASIALGRAARQHPRIRRIVALNPYDYGRGGGIRRSSPLAKVVFTAPCGGR
jgi:pimeloyl-ACP methyl ester carboxylesterase